MIYTAIIIDLAAVVSDVNVVGILHTKQQHIIPPLLLPLRSIVVQTLKRRLQNRSRAKGVSDRGKPMRMKGESSNFCGARPTIPPQVPAVLVRPLLLFERAFTECRRVTRT